MKKTMFKRIFAGLAAMFMMCLCFTIGFAGTLTQQGFEAIAEGKAEIVQIGDGWMLDKNGLLTVFPKTTINRNQFKSNLSIKEVTIGVNCTIREDAFWECTSLTSVTIGDNCTVDNYAFYQCTSLTNVTFGDSCTIGYGAFKYSKIEAVVFTGKSIDSVNVDDYNDEIICNKNGWYKCNKQHKFNTNHKCTVCGYECDKKHTFDNKFTCTICGYFDKAAAQAEIYRIQKLIDENESDNNTASTISTGNPLILLFGGIAVIIGSVAAAIIVKRMKKAL